MLALYLSGSPHSLIIPNGAAWISGAVISLGMMAIAGNHVLRIIPPLTVAALATAFLFPDVEGAHRWIEIGPLHINVAALFLPITVVAIARNGISGPISTLAIILILGLLILQPDASQATAFAIAAWFLITHETISSRAKVLASLLLALSVMFAWMRPDQVQAVAEAELVIALAWQVSPLVASIGVFALAGASLVPLLRDNSLPSTGEARALAAYFTIAALCTLAGNYPVPLIGLGMSFVVGYWLGIGLVCRKQPAMPVSIKTGAGEHTKGET